MDSPNTGNDSTLRLRPNVVMENFNAKISVGTYSFAFTGGDALVSTGLIHYPHLMCAYDASGSELFYVFAESGLFDDKGAVFLGVFEGPGRQNLGMSQLLAVPSFFMAVACAVSRGRLGLSNGAFPQDLQEAEAFKVGMDMAKGRYGRIPKDPDTRRFVQMVSEYMPVEKSHEKDSGPGFLKRLFGRAD